MTKTEFSQQFDILYNNSLSNQAPNLNEYEKSVFATKAEYEILKNYFRKSGNPKQEGFDDSAKRQIDFSYLTKVVKRPAPYSLPPDVFIVLRERVLEDGKQMIVVPISNEEYQRLQSKPYKRPLKHQVWRILEYNVDNLLHTRTEVTLIGHHKDVVFSDYEIVYLRKPKPIILWDEYDSDYTGLTLEEESSVSEIDLPIELHQEVLQRAVELAKAAWQGDLSTSVQMGQRSE